MSLFDAIVGQDLAVSILTRSLSGGAGHAFLFSGPDGVGKRDAAIAFAAGLCCEDDGCGSCETCRRVREGIHPDVEVVVPDGTFIRVDQIREINHDVALRPFESRARVYLLFEAEAMNAEAANAFLRTLEEPPSFVHFILVTSWPDRLLPTVVSRCQRVPFRRIPAGVLADHLRDRYGLTELEATAYARVARGNLDYARTLAGSEAAREQRARLLGWARALPGAGPLETLTMLDEVLAMVTKRADQVEIGLQERRREALEWAGDPRTRKRVEKLFDDRVRRERRRVTTDGLWEVMLAFSGWYRDLASAAVGATDAVLNHDYLYELEAESFPGRVDAYLAAVQAVRRTGMRFRYNVDSRIAFEDMFLSIKEALL